jgi:F-type H+-transporting ATPase subunit delta
MSDAQVARVYATALFQAATDAGTLDETRGDLHAFAGALADTASLADAIFNPQIEQAAKRRVLNELTRGGDKLATNTLAILLDKGRISTLPAVIDEVDRMSAEASSLVDLELTTAVPVDPDMEQRIVARVETATKRSVRLHKTVDPDVIGGLVLRIGDVIIDGSVRSRIRQLHKKLELADVRGGE